MEEKRGQEREGAALLFCFCAANIGLPVLKYREYNIGDRDSSATGSALTTLMSKF